MTCIVGIANKGKVYIEADSLGSNGYTKWDEDDEDEGVL